MEMEEKNNMTQKDSLMPKSNMEQYRCKIIAIVVPFILFITTVIFVLVLIFKADSEGDKDDIITLLYEIKNVERAKNIIHKSFIDLISYMNITNIEKNYNISIEPNDTYEFEETGNYSIKIKFKKKLKTLDYMFEDCSYLKEVNLSNLNTYDIESMSHLFDGCTSLIKIDFGNIDTSI